MAEKSVICICAEKDKEGNIVSENKGMMYWVKRSTFLGFNFDGRARRREYWWNNLYWSLISLGVCLAVNAGIMIIGFIATIIGSELLIGLAALALTHAILISIAIMFIISIGKLLPVTIRRLHDRGLSGWIYLLCIILGNMFCGIGSIVLLVLLCLDSQPGPNNYGPNPKEADMN